MDDGLKGSLLKWVMYQNILIMERHQPFKVNWESLFLLQILCRLFCLRFSNWLLKKFLSVRGHPKMLASMKRHPQQSSMNDPPMIGCL